MKRDKLIWELQLMKTRAPPSNHLRGRPTWRWMFFLYEARGIIIDLLPIETNC